MKKLILVALAALALASCKDEKVDPKYTTLPVISNVIYPSAVYDMQDIPVEADIENKYGIYSALVYYWIGDNSYEGKTVSGQIFVEFPLKVLYGGKIPGQKAGTKVSFQVGSYSPYNKYEPAASEIFTFEVKAGSAPQQ